MATGGWPPLTIPAEQRRDYIQLLADYQVMIGQLNGETGVWPDEPLLSNFNRFCESSYSSTQALVAGAFDVQRKRIIPTTDIR